MNWLLGIYNAHPALFTLVAYYAGSAFVSSLPAPQATSSQVYLFFFRFFNTLAANIARAYSSSVEQSPNFQRAVVKHNVANGCAVPDPAAPSFEFRVKP